jgi:uncharacterized membrane protein
MSWPKHKTVVFYFHSVSWKKNPKWVRSYLTHELALFRYLLDWLTGEDYKVISLLEAHQNGYLFNEKTACLTFDDGYVDFYTFVYPLLKHYHFHATVFVSPLLVNPDLTKRKVWNLVDRDAADFECWGYLNWAEMEEMEKSGWVSVESHTYTHLKYPKSDVIVDFHRPHSNCMYPVGWYFPERMWDYIQNDQFEHLIPYGFPFFEQGSACITKKRVIHPRFVQGVTAILQENEFFLQPASSCLEKIYSLYHEYKANNNIFLSIESDEEFAARIQFEVQQSKVEIEKRLNKKVNFLCWPHGDNSLDAHRIALQSGYLATTIGNQFNESEVDSTRIPRRFTIQPWRGSRYLGLLKMRLKLSDYQEKRWIQNLLKLIR